MKYEDLMAAIERYGSTPDGMCRQTLGVTREQIHERVIIAPWWEPSVFESLGSETRFLSASENSAVKVWNIQVDNVEMTYIKTGIGAPVLTDAILALGVTACKKVLFIGSVGSLDVNIGIGDIVVPEYSMSGDGVSRYLKGGLLRSNDTFGDKSYPDEELFELLLHNVQKVCGQTNVKYHVGKTFSIDTIFAQFAYIDEIIALGCNVIEMETASAFRAAALAGISLGALFSVSDNTVMKKSLYGGRTTEEIEYRKEVRRAIFPKIILETLGNTEC
jgi:purine-nucleoside phosphorylase